MPTYKVFRLKENLRQQFRWAPHLSGITAVKPRDYEDSFEVEASSLYAAWHDLKGTESELAVGDLLAYGETEVRILKYIGFEEARWVIPEMRVAVLPPPPDSAQSTSAVG